MNNKEDSRNESENKYISEIIRIWEKTIEVQQHFNEIEMKIRNYAITVIGAILGLYALLLKGNTIIEVSKYSIHVSFFVIVFACFILIAFFFMDRYWYHKLLLGAVKHGIKIEESIENVIPEISLSRAIKEESPITYKCIKIRSSQKIFIFYSFFMFGLLCLLALSIFLSINQNKDNERNENEEVVGVSIIKMI